MRIIILSIIILISNHLSSANFEEKVCNCIAVNFVQVDQDFEEIMRLIESDLISNKIINSTEQSIIEQLNTVSIDGEIVNSRNYKNVFWESMGKRTINHCVKLHTYGNQDVSVSGMFRMISELEQLDYHQQKPIDLNYLRKEIAKIILRYSPIKSSKLWKFIQLDYLYRLSETKEIKNLNELLSFSFEEQDTTNTIHLHVGADDKILLEEKEININETCRELSNYLIEKKGIYFSCERNTKYKTYLKVYNDIKDCVSSLRNEKSIEFYNKTFESLSEQEMMNIKEQIPLRIIENEPK